MMACVSPVYSTAMAVICIVCTVVAWIIYLR